MNLPEDAMCADEERGYPEHVCLREPGHPGWHLWTRGDYEAMWGDSSMLDAMPLDNGPAHAS